MRLSAKADYALRALVEIAATSPSVVLPARVIAARQQIPLMFLNNILSDLQRGGLIISKRGVQGGWTLARPPSQITVAEVMKATTKRATGLADGAATVPRTAASAAVDAMWTALQRGVDGLMAATTLQDLLHASAGSDGHP